MESLKDSLNPDYDGYYEAFPQVRIDECLLYQSVDNESPFYPEGIETGLGLAHRRDTDNFRELNPNPVKRIAGNAVPAGGPEQRHATMRQLLDRSRILTNEELEYDPSQDSGALVRREG